jgi:hypothetical protein
VSWIVSESGTLSEFAVRSHFGILAKLAFVIPSANIHLTGYYQYQELANYKHEFIQFMKEHPQDVLQTDRNQSYTVGSLMNTDVPIHDYVLHIRLEDFVEIKEFIPVETLITGLQTVPFSGSVAIVMNSPKSDFETNYLNQVVDWFIEREIIPVLETNSLERDFAIMRMSKHLICSKSTISWCAALLSETMEICYMPDYTIFRDHQTMKRPHVNTIFYTV